MDLLINFSDQDSKKLLFQNLKNLDGEFLVKIQRKPKRRTNQVNKYYWGVVLEYISQETGENKNLLHELMKDRFIPNVVFLDAYDLSTASLDTVQMWEYIEMIRAWSVGFLNCYIPEPNEVILN